MYYRRCACHPGFWLKHSDWFICFTVFAVSIYLLFFYTLYRKIITISQATNRRLERKPIVVWDCMNNI